MEKIVQRIYVKINPKTQKVMISCTLDEGYHALYVANYPADQEQLKKDYEGK